MIIFNEDMLEESMAPSGPIKRIPVPQTPIMNLKSKIGSLLRNLDQLAAKKARIEFEMKKQSKALYTRRLELKKLSKSTNVKAKIVLEDNLNSNHGELEEETKAIQTLLQESDQKLKELGF